MNILIVEDETLVAMGMEMTLAGDGHTVVDVVRTADEAIKLVPDDLDLALLDNHLAEGSSGLEAAEGLSRQHIPCLFVTSDCPEEAADLALGCLYKPFSEQELLEAVYVCKDLIAGIYVPPAKVPNHMVIFTP